MIAEKLSNYIQEKGIKQKYICEKTGISKQSISCLLNGKRKLTIDEYALICTALELPPEYFFDCKPTG